jgi:dienelactone hydrolase
MVLGLFLATGATACLGSPWQSVPFPGADGTSVSAEYYRPVSPSSAGVVFFPAINGSTEPWRPLADSLAARGYNVLLARLHDPERPVTEVSRRGRGTSPAKDEILRDALSAARTLREAVGDSLRVLVWGGVELGGAAAAVAASRDERPPAGLLLVSPSAEVSGIPIAPILVGLEKPALLISGRDDPLSGDAARRIYIEAAGACQLWEYDGGARGEHLLFRRPLVAGDLAAWIVRSCPPVGGASVAPGGTPGGRP